MCNFFIYHCISVYRGMTTDVALSGCKEKCKLKAVPDPLDRVCHPVIHWVWHCSCSIFSMT